MSLLSPLPPTPPSLLPLPAGHAGGTGAPAPAASSPEFRLLNDYQRGFPLRPAPYAVIGDTLGLAEHAVIAAYRRWLGDGTLSRIGAVLAPGRIGASVLAALSAPPARLDEIARRVSAVAEVNHNYEREHAYNLWFVVTAASCARLAAVIAQIEADTGCAVIQLPLAEAYHIDLGFDLASARHGAGGRARPADRPGAGRRSLTPAECALIAALQDGLPLEPRPFAALGGRARVGEATAIRYIERWLAEGLVKRFGVVVRHHELGFGANAMCVWKIPDDLLGELGRALAAEPGVTLCYRRRPAAPAWEYNLFCMIHGRAREAVLAVREAAARRLGLDAWPHAVLFSRRRFKQQGACYLPPALAAGGQR